MSETLEQNQGLEAEVTTAQTETTVENGDVQIQEPAKAEEIPEWEKRIRAIEEQHKQELKRLEHGLGKSIGKLRKQNSALKEVVQKIIPESTSMQFKSEEERKAYESYVKPIQDTIVNTEKQLEKEDSDDQILENRTSLAKKTLEGLGTIEGASEVFTSYQTAIASNPEYDVDEDILSFTAQAPAMLKTLYSNPEIVVALKKLPHAQKIANLTSIMIQSMTAQPAVKPVVAPKVNQPATPPKSGGGGQAQNIYSLDGDAFLKAHREAKRK
jgi:hypothetical protein